jgi:hypothetical protein
LQESRGSSTHTAFDGQGGQESEPPVRPSGPLQAASITPLAIQIAERPRRMMTSGDSTTGGSVSQPIRVFVTGGTFDKEYDELRGRLYFKDTHVGEMLRLARCRLEVTTRTLMMIDSARHEGRRSPPGGRELRLLRGVAHRRHARHRHHA